MATEQDAFLAAIRADPGDDTPRLVYADWLQEHGDEDRAEFVRVQCELARIPPRPAADAPPLVHGLWRRQGGDRYHGLSTRSDDLLRAHAPRWAFEDLGATLDLWQLEASLSVVARYVGGRYTDHGVFLEFRRGFVGMVGCDGGTWAEHGDAICERLPVRAVRFTDEGPEIEEIGEDVVNDEWVHTARIAGQVVSLRQRELTGEPAPALWQAALSKRWPSIPRAGWDMVATRHTLRRTVLVPLGWPESGEHFEAQNRVNSVAFCDRPPGTVQLRHVEGVEAGDGAHFMVTYTFGRPADRGTPAATAWGEYDFNRLFAPPAVEVWAYSASTYELPEATSLPEPTPAPDTLRCFARLDADTELELPRGWTVNVRPAPHDIQEFRNRFTPPGRSVSVTLHLRTTEDPPVPRYRLLEPAATISVVATDQQGRSYRCEGLLRSIHLDASRREAAWVWEGRVVAMPAHIE